MKKRVIILIITTALLLVSCASISTPGYQNGLHVKLEPKEYDILGEVVSEGTIRSVLGIITWGGAQYYDLIQQAKEKYNADDVINISIDRQNIIFCVVYLEQTYLMRGLAIKYKN